jgi:poly(A) polymerase
MATEATALLTRLGPLTPQEIYLVGGSVRDLLIGAEIKDIDIVMPAGSALAAQKFADEINGSFFFLDETRKMTRVVKHGLGVGQFQFDFADFIGPDLAADLGRRDFTANAMALDLRAFLQSGSLDSIVDLFHGRADVKNRIIRVVKPEVLDEDPLRLLRAVRFAATLGFTIEAGTGESIRARAALLSRPSPERIRDEFFQILAQRNADRFLVLMDQLGLLPRLLPELDALTGFSPGRYHTYDVRTHSIKAVAHIDSVLGDLPELSPQHARRVYKHLEAEFEHFVPRIAALRFAGLLHDIAKPETFSRDADGHIHFYGHDTIGADKARDICRRFRLSRDAESMVTGVIRQHMRLFNLSRPVGPSKNAMYRYCRDLRDAVPESLILAQADARATYDIMPKEMFTDTEKPMSAVLDYYFEKYIRTGEKPLVTGQDLIDRGLVPGPAFGKILDDIREQQAAGALKNRHDALVYLDSLK